jgi:O-antigen ligase
MIAQQFITKQQYPWRYWLLIAYLVGVPGFVKFDPSGLTHDYGVFNPVSIAQIALTLGCAVLLCTITLTNNRSIHQRKINFHYWFWAWLIGILMLASIASPQDNVWISAYRMFEWLVFYFLLASAYTREPVERAEDFLRHLIMKLINLSIAVVIAGLVVDPTLAYWSPEETSGTLEIRLGGYIVSSNVLGVLGGIGVIHSLIYRRGSKRLSLMAVYGLISILTISREAWVGFLIAFAVYVILVPSFKAKAISILGVFGAGAIGLFFSDRVLALAERGQGASGLTTLSDRTFVWIAAWSAFTKRPYIGYGFVDGVKQILRSLFSYSWWTPPNCHNEILQALVSGGIVCGILVLLLYFGTLLTLFRHTSKRPRDPEGLFFLLVFIQVTAYAMATPALIQFHGPIGSLFLICFMACFDAIPMQNALRQRAQPQFSGMSRAGA